MSVLRPLSLIVALDAQGVIGKDNGIPWHHAEDMRHFRRVTTGHAIIMGRATYESIGKPLPKRHNIVVTTQRDYRAQGCLIAHDLPSALELAYGLDAEPCIVGGAQLYREALPLVTRMYLTLVPGSHQGDSFFPTFDEAQFREVERREEAAMVFRTLERVRSTLDLHCDAR